MLVDASELDPVEKTLILFRHAKAAALTERGSRDRCACTAPRSSTNQHFTPERIRRSDRPPAEPANGGVAEAIRTELTTATEAMATSFATLGQRAP